MRPAIVIERDGASVELAVVDPARGTVAVRVWEDPREALRWSRTFTDMCHRAIAEDQLGERIDPPNTTEENQDV